MVSYVNDNGCMERIYNYACKEIGPLGLCLENSGLSPPQPRLYPIYRHFGGGVEDSKGASRARDSYSLQRQSLSSLLFIVLPVLLFFFFSIKQLNFQGEKKLYFQNRDGDMAQ